MVRNAFNLPDLPAGDQQLVFLGHQSGARVVAKFVVLPFTPSLQLTSYAGRPGTQIAFTGDGWARDEALHAFVGEGNREIAAFHADAALEDTPP